MGISYGVSPIAQNQLVYYIDFSNIKSYPGTGTALTGLANQLNSTYSNNTGALTYNIATKSMKRATPNNGADLFRSSSNVLLGTQFTMHVLTKVWACHSGTANGILSNHSHTANSGAGINIVDVSATDFRISCNTGSGLSRTYNAYYGTTNIYNKWAFLTLRFSGSSFTLWVNDGLEYTGSYAQYNDSQPIDLFNWSTTYDTTNSYRPACEISMAAVYNRALADEEIKNNFRMYRGRFGL